MPSVIGLLEERERGARQRVEELREEADRVLEQLRDAELDWERFVVARETVGEVLVGREDDAAAVTSTEKAGESVSGVVPVAVNAAAPRSVVPVWREGVELSVLLLGYQRILQVLAAGQGSLACKEIVQGLGLELVPAKIEVVRSKANRLVRQGWLAKEPSGRFTLPGVRGGGS
ncbi:hypothetical protein [Streptomyces yanii]|uniref:hypothetical protein n=1 Tax=Streptomyces yanii TaxID=78510 RepID=UPI0031E6DF7F